MKDTPTKLGRSVSARMGSSLPVGAVIYDYGRLLVGDANGFYKEQPGQSVSIQMAKPSLAVVKIGSFGYGMLPVGSASECCKGI